MLQLVMPDELTSVLFQLSILRMKVRSNLLLGDLDGIEGSLGWSD